MNTNSEQTNSATHTLVVPVNIQKITAHTAMEIVQHFDLQEKSVPLLTSEQTPAEFLQILINNEHYLDAIALLAHGMPVREATWWACLCARDHFEHSDQLNQQTLISAEQWVQQPTEEHRREAEKHAEATDYNSPASWTAAAAFWSGDSIASEDEPMMAPPPFLYAHAVSGAIVMSATLDMPTETELKERYQRYLKQAITIANNGNES